MPSFEISAFNQVTIICVKERNNSKLMHFGIETKYSLTLKSVCPSPLVCLGANGKINFYSLSTESRYMTWHWMGKGKQLLDKKYKTPLNHFHVVVAKQPQNIWDFLILIPSYHIFTHSCF